MIKSLENKKNRLFIFVFQSLMIIGLYLCLKIGMSAEIVGKLSSLLLIFSAVWMVLRAHLQKNKILLIFFLFMSIYTFPTKIYFFDKIPFSAHNLSYNYDSAIITTFVFCIFYMFLNLFVYIKKESKEQMLEIYRNDLFFWGLIFLGFGIVYFLLSGEYLLSGLAYGVGEKEKTPLNEYAIILFILAYRYSGNVKWHTYVLYVLLFYYIAKNLLLGGRIETIMVLIAFLTVKFQHLYSYRRILFLMLGGMFLMNVMSNIRANPMTIIEGDVLSVLNIFGGDVTDRFYQATNEGDVFWGGERIIQLINEGYLDISDRLNAGISFLFSPIHPEPFLLTNFGLDIKSSGGGGLAPIFFYAFAGLLGVFILAYFIATMLNLLNKEISQSTYFYIVLLISTLPRWFVYYPIFIVKFCIIGFILFKITSLLHSSLKKNSVRFNLNLTNLRHLK